MIRFAPGLCVSRAAQHRRESRDEERGVLPRGLEGGVSYLTDLYAAPSTLKFKYPKD